LQEHNTHNSDSSDSSNDGTKTTAIKKRRKLTAASTPVMTDELMTNERLKRK
ncbi:9315_t:CDS:1, partial [Dentiscutata erythropus]